MKVKIGGIKRGKREHLFTGDEAEVSRIWMPGKEYDGMVERIQPLKNTETSGRINIIRGDGNAKAAEMRGMPSNDPLYPLIKFYAARLAIGKFPQNFVDLKELRYIKKEGEFVSAIYSDFIEDMTNERENRKKAMERYYRLNDIDQEAEANEFRSKNDQEHRKKHPEIQTLVGKFEREGLEIIHPEANYQIDKNGNIVFFEIGTLNIKEIRITNAGELLIASLIESAEIIRAVRAQIRESETKNKQRSQKMRKRIKSSDFFKELVVWLGIKSILTETTPGSRKAGETIMDEIEENAEKLVQRIGHKEKREKINNFFQEVDKTIGKIISPNKIFDFIEGPV